MAKPETNFYNNMVKPRLAAIPGLWFEKISQKSIRGIPDLVIVYKGWAIFWEMKVPPNKVAYGSLQWHKLTSISNAGGVAREVTPDTLEEAIEEILCLDGFRIKKPLAYQHPQRPK